ncbi:MAG: hypothetical protein Q8K75_09540 [Chlamydiales bacterium]|nr:hypothetical protein [Chlamydiales bacterium]
MSATPKRKLCWNCDGSVPLAVDQCTYCGASLREGASPQPVKKVRDDLAPPYAMHGGQRDSSDIPQPPFNVLQKEAAKPVEEEEATEETTAGANKELSPLMFLLGGSVFFLFGLVLKLFSQNGEFTLQWSSDYWYVYLFGGIALLIFGCRSLKYVEDSD